ncbi:hypothetical protein [Arenimonas sp.]|jgi:hypothetical protein|uniref:hypothetical protein n=1 Tax=Arenimonas sp. TaxID=1872635 RepID=UPI0037C1859A
MTTTTTTARTFTAEGETFTTKSKARYAVVLTCSGGVYCSDRDYGVPGSGAGAVVMAKHTSNSTTAVKALVRYAKDLTRDGAPAGSFVSGSVVDTETGEIIANA